MEAWSELINRVKKNLKKLKSFSKKGIVCYRVYDRDIPDFPFIVDRYQDELVVYIRAKKNFYEKYPERSNEDDIKESLSFATGVSVENIHLMLSL